MLAFACWGFWLSSTCWWCKLENQGVVSSLIKCFPAKRKANKCQKSCLCVGRYDLWRPSQQIVFRVRVPFWVKMTKSPKQLTRCCPPVDCPDYIFPILCLSFCLSVCPTSPPCLIAFCSHIDNREEGWPRLQTDWFQMHLTAQTHQKCAHQVAEGLFSTW